MANRLLENVTFPVMVWGGALESQAEQQLRNLAEMPGLYRHVAAMPDAHLGIGATVGTVLASESMIIPAAVGVDIGCGVSAARLALDRGQLGGAGPIGELRRRIEDAIPLGFSQREPEQLSAETVAWADRNLRKSSIRAPLGREILEKARLQLGTLGGGNHFIEVCHDQADRIWLMLHSGSRHIGKRIADHYIKRAKQALKRRGALADLPDVDLAYFTKGDQDFSDYLADLYWAQEYARFNRQEMMRRCLREIAAVTGPEGGKASALALVREQVDCHHNYVARECHFGRKVYVTRKGALSAKKGQLAVIPGSMGACSFIVTGLGQADSFHSCAHGAGRAMSRREAKRRFNLADLARQTEGVDCRKDKGVLDEIPQAYKDIGVVMAQQADLVSERERLKQLICVKG